MPKAESTWRLPNGSESLGEYLRHARQHRGLSQDDLVRRTTLSLSAIRKIEDGRTHSPGLFTVLALWDLLGLPLEGMQKLRNP